MKITDIQVDGFGVWKGLFIESLGDDITVFCGQNEAGKTTLMQFIRSMLFGFSEDRREKYVPPVYGGLAGGSLDVRTPIGSFDIQRHIDPKRVADPTGDLAVTDSRDGAVHGREQLGGLLSGIDESIFNNVFAIGLREIQELGALNSTEAADHLYRLTSGLDRVSLIDVMHDLKQRREEIWASDAEESSRLGELADRRIHLHGEIDTLRQRSKRWSQIAVQSREALHQLKDLSEQMSKLDRESRLVDISMQLSSRWQQRHGLIEQIKAFGKLPDIRDLSIDRLDRLNEKIASQKERIEQIKSRRRSIKADAEKLPINRTLWAQKGKIEAISEHAPWVESLERQANRLRDEIANVENSMVGEVKGLGSQLQIRAKDVQELENRGLGSLQESGQTLMEQRERLNRLKQELDKADFDLDQQEDLLGTTASQSAADSLDDTSRYVNRLRRRIELGEKIDKLTRARQDLEHDIDDVINEQVLPVGKLAIIGVVVVIGFILVTFGLVDSLWTGRYFGNLTGEAGLMLMIMGAVFGFVSIGLKYHWERVAKDELDDFRHQMDIVRQQLKRAKTERDDVSKHLPASVVQFDLELKDAESRLAKMEDLIPLEKRVNGARSHIEEVKRRITNQQHEVETAEKLWHANLRTTGLPEAVEPLQLKEIIERSGRISDYYFRLDQFKLELDERNKELDAINKRIELCYHEAGLALEPASSLDRINQLLMALNEQRALVRTRQEAAAKYQGLRGRLAKAKRELDKSFGQKRRLLAKIGCDTESEYRDIDAQHNQRNHLVEQRNNLDEQLQAGLGTHFNERELSDYIESYGVNGLQKRAIAIGTDSERTKEEEAKLLLLRGEYNQEIKMLGEDSRLDEALLELNSVDAEIDAIKKEWQVYASTTQLLETIREGYEARRQPETLKEASGYLEQLTDGHYKRIWTRLVGEELFVDNQSDETITVDKLSRGTREAVYLSLRLALVGAYARRGAVMPLVLDDVLVNFDARRARAAAKLLCDFSKNGYQILMFTCHEHMQELFFDLDAKVKVLPNHRDVVDSGATPTDYRPESTPAKIAAPQPEQPSIPAFTPAISQVDLQTDLFDPELEYELSAVVTDQREERKLRHEMIYISPNTQDPIDLSGDDDLWKEMPIPLV